MCSALFSCNINLVQGLLETISKVQATCVYVCHFVLSREVGFSWEFAVVSFVDLVFFIRDSIVVAFSCHERKFVAITTCLVHSIV